MDKRVVILAGPRPPYGFCTVPPLTDSAPERNLYRLTEQDYGDDLNLTVISACSESQLKELVRMNPSGRYRWVAFPDSSLETKQSRWQQNRLAVGFCRRVLATPDFFTWRYLNQASQMIKEIRPHLILINSLPQYIPFLKRRFPHTRMGLFVRGTMGESRRYLPNLALIITNSVGMTNYILQLLNGAAVPVRQIPNTLDDSFCVTAKEYADSKRIIYTGRIDPAKGVWELLRAFEQVHAILPQATLMIVGGNFGQRSLSDYERKLMEFASEHKLPVMFISQVMNEKLPDFYKQADLAVFPSICLESFGMVALEAMRCGLPIVASRRPGFEELIVEDETGLIVNDPEDIPALASTILTILWDSAKIKRMGLNGYQRSLNFTPKKSAEKFLQIIEDLE